MQPNRRNNPRAKTDFLLNAFQEGLPSLCAATDLSEGGIGVRRLNAIRTANTDAIEVEFVLPGVDEIISASGRLRTADGATAVVFESMADAHRALIRQYVAAA